jgi:putative FmdB family regulatory protein
MLNKEREMPIYEYRCRKCGKIFEKIQKVNGGGNSLTCPSCGGKKPEKLLSSFSSSKESDSSSSCGPTGGSSRFT